MLHIYGCPQTRSSRATWALEEAGAEYGYTAVDLRNGEHKKPEFLMVNPSGKVPALTDGALNLSESAAIVTYVGEKYPASGLVPSDAFDRAHYFQWCFFVMSELETPLWTMAKHTQYLPEERRVPAVSESCLWEFDLAVKIADQHLQGREFVVGNHFSGADILISATLNWARSLGATLPPSLETYANKMLARPALAKARAREAQAIEVRN